jgi:hypothetical protein
MQNIPIVTSNDDQSISIFRIPACDYSTECPESKRFESYHNGNGNDNDNGNGNGNENDNDNGISRNTDGNSNSNGISSEIVMVPNHSVDNADNANNATRFGRTNSGTCNVIPNCCLTKPLTTTKSGAGAGTGTGTGTGVVMMNAIGQDCNKQWDAILSIRYYDIVKRHVQYLSASVSTSASLQQSDAQSKSNSSTGSSSISTTSSASMHHTIEINTTITTVADLHIQISPTSKPFTNNKHQNYHAQYNHSITLFAKSFTNEYSYPDNNSSDFKTMQGTQSHIENPKYTWSDVVPQIVFSSNDNRFISCIIPHPHPIPEQLSSRSMLSKKPCSLSSVVIFSLDWKKKSRTMNMSSSRNMNHSNHNGVTQSSSSLSSSLSSATFEKSQNTMTKADTKIPIPFYVQATLDDENSHHHQSNSSTSISSNMPSINTPSIHLKKDYNNNNDNKQYNHNTPKIILPSHAPTIYNPRTVTIDDTFYEQTSYYNKSHHHSYGQDNGTPNHSHQHHQNNNYDEMLDQKASILLSQITSICDIHNTNDYDDSNSRMCNNVQSHSGKNIIQAHPLLLAGCNDGSILLIGYKRAKLMALLYYHATRTSTTNDDDEPRSNVIPNECGIVHMMYMSSPISYYDHQSEEKTIHCNGKITLNGKTSNDHYHSDIGCRYGRIIIIQRNGETVFYNSHFYSASNYHHNQKEKQYNNSNNIRRKKNPIHIQREVNYKLLYKDPKHNDNQHNLLKYCHGIFLEYDVVAFLIHPFSQREEESDKIAQIWYIGDIDKGSGGLLMNEFMLNDERLTDLNHGFLPMKKESSGSNNSHDFSGPGSSLRTVCLRHFIANFKLHHDKRTNSLVISSAISTSTSGSTIFLRPFVTMWNWETSRIGFTLLGETWMKHECMEDNLLNSHYLPDAPPFMNDWSMVKNEKQSYSLQNFCLCYNTNRGYKLSYISQYDDEIFQKQLLSVGLLSPSSSRNNDWLLNDVKEPSSLFLNHDSLLFLHCTPVSIIIFDNLIEFRLNYEANHST